MSVFDRADFDAHEQVVFASDAESGLRAIIAIHDTSLGPALGGCRMWTYASHGEAIRDALRLSRGMTYKAALAGLPLGGGKSVILGDAKQDKTPALMRAMGQAVDRLAGRYTIAEDVGTTVDDMVAIAGQTRHVVGLPRDKGGSGDPSPSTAYGVFLGIRAALAERSIHKMDGVRVAVQGLGNVGWQLCRRLHEAGARLIVADIDQGRVDRAIKAFGAEQAAPDCIHAAEAEVYAPCALGATVNVQSIPEIKANIIAGSANNQLATAQDGERLAAREILYVPDYAINAGGLIQVAGERFGDDAAATKRRLEAIETTVREIFEMARNRGITTAEAADRVAEKRFTPHGAALAA
jgi:leucine dehydrogenase